MPCQSRLIASLAELSVDRVRPFHRREKYGYLGWALVQSVPHLLTSAAFSCSALVACHPFQAVVSIRERCAFEIVVRLTGSHGQIIIFFRSELRGIQISLNNLVLIAVLQQLDGWPMGSDLRSEDGDVNKSIAHDVVLVCDAVGRVIRRAE